MTVFVFQMLLYSAFLVSIEGKCAVEFYKCGLTRVDNTTRADKDKLVLKCCTYVPQHFTIQEVQWEWRENRVHGNDNEWTEVISGVLQTLPLVTSGDNCSQLSLAFLRVSAPAYADKRFCCYVIVNGTSHRNSSAEILPLSRVQSASPKGLSIATVVGITGGSLLGVALLVSSILAVFPLHTERRQRPLPSLSSSSSSSNSKDSADSGQHRTAPRFVQNADVVIYDELTSAQSAHVGSAGVNPGVSVIPDPVIPDPVTTDPVIPDPVTTLIPLPPIPLSLIPLPPIPLSLIPQSLIPLCLIQCRIVMMPKRSIYTIVVFRIKRKRNLFE
ncbi:uncharacterized protein [Littorina saxatilis]|uniref:uncharacterized protein n=1 Tax=Littorina saxatilis TaxID=31220 RepID=UPI0038B670B2